MTFTTSLRLNSSGFKKGVKDVQKSLNSLKNSFLSLAGALGVGLGFTKLVSQLKDTAVSLNVAKSVLENVSRETKTYTDGVNKMEVSVSNFNENLEYTRRLAKDYSQDLVSIIENFAQFHAACEKTNLGLEQQKDVFESLTKAAAYYHLSADKAKDMMTAITQMMSKGKVASEELRRQLGNVLPGAFNLMAAALGVSNAELEDMMKKGQVLSAEALPRFAAMLNTVTKNANFDSLQLQMNKLKNTWYELVERSGAEGMFTKAVEGANDFLSVITRNFNEVKAAAKGLLMAFASYKLFGMWKKEGEQFMAETDKLVAKLERQLKKLQAEAERFSTGMAMPTIRVDSKGVGRVHAAGAIDEQGLKAVKEYNDTLIKVAKTRRSVLLPMSQERREQTEIIRLAKIQNAEIAKQLGLNRENALAVGLMQKAWAGAVSFVKNIGQMLKGLGWMALVSAIIGAITSIISYMKDMKAKWEEIRNIVKDYERDVAQVDVESAKSEKILRSYLKTLQDTKKSEQSRLNALREINKLMGTNYTSDALDKTKQAYKDIVKEVERWIEATKLQAKIQIQATKAAEAEASIAKLENGLKEKQLEYDRLTTVKGSDENGNPVRGAKRLADRWKVKKLEEEMRQDKTAIEQFRRVVGLAESELERLGVKLSEVTEQNNEGPGGGQSDISKVYEKFTKEKQELANKLHEHAISQEEYNKELDKLNIKYFESAAETGKLSIDKIIEKFDKGQALTKMEAWYKELAEAAQKAAMNALAESAAEAMEKALDDSIKEADKVLEKAAEDAADKAIKIADANFNALTTGKPKSGKRDKTFDYKKSGSEILGDQLDVTNDFVEQMQDAINEIVSSYDNFADAAEAVKNKIAEMKNELIAAKQEAKTLEEAMKLQQIQEDIDELNDSINDAVYGGMKNFAQSTDRIVKGWESVRETFEDVDATPWERFMAIFNETVQIMDTFLSLAETLNSIAGITAQLENAKVARQAQMNKMLAEEITLRSVLKKVIAGTATESEKAIAAQVLEAYTAKKVASAKAGEAVAGATASGAKLAFPYNLLAIAAGVAAVLTALASAKKFASGGIVGGNSYTGDRTTARVNSGEMILNKAQQGTLWNMINGKGGFGNHVDFKIRGADLIGVMNNEMSRRRG